jgi:hypothetical protein
MKQLKLLIKLPSKQIFYLLMQLLKQQLLEKLEKGSPSLLKRLET